MKRLMVISGGTGGHVFPGLGVAQYLINQDWQVRWLGTSNHIEADLVPKYGIEIDFICISSWRWRGMKAILSGSLYILNACYQARAIIQRFKPNVVLGTGGYVSGPGVLAAWSLGVPVLLHEQNSIAGLTNKWLAKISSKVVQGFPGAFPRAEVVGNPVRVDILGLPQPKARMLGRTGPVRVLVIGGSQGASVFNHVMPQVASKLGNAIDIWHQSGRGFQFKVEQAYATATRRLQLHYKVSEFIDDIASAYAWADIIISRSGAMTVSEIAAAGLPALFVPFQHKDNHQYWNALQLEKIGAAKIFKQSHFSVDTVASILKNWNRSILLEMGQRARSVAITDATQKVAQEIISLAKIKSS